MPANNRYLIVTPAYPPPFVGGSRVWTYNMVENCPENFDILTSAMPAGYGEVSSPRHRVFRSRYIWNTLNGDPGLIDLFVSYAYILLWVIQRLISVKYDAVIAGGETFVNGLLFLVGKCFRVPVIGLGNTEEFTIPLKGRGLKNFIKRQWMKFTHKRATGFVAVCHFCRDVLSSIGIDAQRIDVVPSSINAGKLKPREKDRPWGHNVLSVGRLVERKGFHYLIEAVYLLKDELTDIKLTIVGDGPFKPIVLEKIKSLELAGRVSLRGQLNDDELCKLYRESDLFVLAHMMLENGDTEGCPTVFSEASGNGLPVIGGTGGGASTAIVEGKTGFVVDSRDVQGLASKIKKILTNPRLAEEMGRAGIEKVKRDHLPQKTGLCFSESIRRLANSTGGVAGLSGLWG